MTSHKVCVYEEQFILFYVYNAYASRELSGDKRAQRKPEWKICDNSESMYL